MSLDFWKKVQSTNPKYTKPAKVSGQMRTVVDAQYKKMMITEQFGMMGLGWGVIPSSEKYERIYYEDTCILNYMATAFYVWEGERAEFPIAAQIKESYQTRGANAYLKIDDEAVKKVRTDALTKGFTDLGFCADIHMSMFDDQDYVQTAARAAQLKELEEKEAAAKLAYEEIRAWLVNEIEAARSVKTDSSFYKTIDSLIRKVTTRCQAAGLYSCVTAFKTKLETVKEERKNAN